MDNLNSVSGSCSDGGLPAMAVLQAAVNAKVLSAVYVALANFCLIYTHSAAWSLFGERLVRRLRERYLAALLRQEPAFFDELGLGELSARLAGDIETIQTGTSDKVGICISSLAYFAAAYGVAFSRDAALTTMLAALIPAFVLMVTVGGRAVACYAAGVSDTMAAATGIVAESLANMPVVLAFSAAAKLEAVFADRLRLARGLGLKRAVASASQLGVMFFIGYAANALAFWQGSHHIAAAAAGPGGDTGSTVGAVYTVILVMLDGTPPFLLRWVW